MPTRSPTCLIRGWKEETPAYAGVEFWNGTIDDLAVAQSVAGIMMYLASVFNAGARCTC